MSISHRRALSFIFSALLLLLVGIDLTGSLWSPLLGNLGRKLRHTLYAPLFSLGIPRSHCSF